MNIVCGEDPGFESKFFHDSSVMNASWHVCCVTNIFWFTFRCSFLVVGGLEPDVSPVTFLSEPDDRTRWRYEPPRRLQYTIFMHHAFQSESICQNTQKSLRAVEIPYLLRGLKYRETQYLRCWSSSGINCSSITRIPYILPSCIIICTGGVTFALNVV